MMHEKVRAVQEAIEKMNAFGKQKKPFLFIIDFEQQHPVVEPLPLSCPDILFDINGIKNEGTPVKIPEQHKFGYYRADFNRYKKAFNKVKKHLQNGNSYLVNLTQPSEITTDLSLLQLFHLAKARYKLYFKDQFVVFSPETFVKIEEGQIHSFPMKGTIDASLPDARAQLLNSKKERAEHLTMVDLIRNDLSRIAKQVKVKKLCYLDLIKTNTGALWQMSSEITGSLPKNFHEKIGSMLFSMLPAGSVSGAPKDRTREIISQTENYTRGYYTGVFGYFDGSKMDSAVMIRFIEKNGDQLIYKSGGGITTQSDLKSEYRELIQKIYVPIN